MSKQFDAINTTGSYCWIVMHKPLDTAIVHEAMAERGYKNMSYIFWEKPNHYVEGPNTRLTPSVEMGTVGCYPDASHIKVNASSNPRDRPNIVRAPSVLTLAKDLAGNVINATEKPPGLAQWLFNTYCPKGSTVLIVGTGAGGCVKGAVEAGMNVIGVENDEKQFKALESEMHKWIADTNKAPPKPKLRYPADDKIDKLSPVKKPSGGNLIEDRKGEEVAVSVGKCFNCDEAGSDDDPLLPCSSCEKIGHAKSCWKASPTPEGAPPSADRLCGGCRNMKLESMGLPAE